MLISFEIENLLTFHNATNISFPPPTPPHSLNTIGIYGETGAGKTNLCAAFKEFQHIATEAPYGWTEQITLPRFSQNLNKNTVFKLTFRESLNTPCYYLYELCLSQEAVIRESLHTLDNNNDNSCVVFTRKETHATFLPNTRYSGAIKQPLKWEPVLFLAKKQAKHGHPIPKPLALLLNEISCWNITWLNNQIVEETIRDVTNPSIESSSRFFLTTPNNKTRKQVLTLLKMVDPTIQDIEVAENVTNLLGTNPINTHLSVVHQYKNHTSTVPLYQDAAGVACWFHLVLPLYKVLTTGGVLVLDNIDTLPGRLQTKLLALFHQNPNAQLIYTTFSHHTFPLLDSNELWIMQNKQGESHLTQVSPHDAKLYPEHFAHNYARTHGTILNQCLYGA